MILRPLNIHISIFFRYEKLENCALEIHAFCVFVIENAKYNFLILDISVSSFQMIYESSKIFS